MRSKLIAGTLTFGEAVNRYSDDESSKFTAGMLQGTNGTFLTMDQLDAGLVSMMNKMKVGEYSQPVEYTDDRGRKAVRIVYLKTRTEPHRENLKDDYSKIAARALEEKKEEVLEQWFDRQIKNYYIRVDDEYRDCPQMKKWFEAAESYSGSAHK